MTRIELWLGDGELRRARFRYFLPEFLHHDVLL
jgi:hypothetical protein